jgi:Ca-activated chloride channel family protein
MRAFRRALCALVLALMAGAQVGSAGLQAPGQAPAAPGAQQTPQVGRVRRQVVLVNVVFSVLDRKNRFVTDLGREDFQVFEDGIPQHIEFFNRETNLPLRIGLLMDTSNSIRSRLEFEQNAAFDFLYRVLQRGRDLAFVMTFDSTPEVQQDFTDDLEALRSTIFRQRAGGGTALYDAIYQASLRLMNPPPAPNNQDVRRVLVVISDGLDNLSNHTRSEALEMAERAGVVIYPISTSVDWVAVDQRTPEGLPLKLHLTEGDEVLQQFADESGGRPFFPYHVSDLEQAFAAIGTELRSQYAIAYTPATHQDDGKYHRIEIQVMRKGLSVRARRGYWAERLRMVPAPSS